MGPERVGRRLTCTVPFIVSLLMKACFGAGERAYSGFRKNSILLDLHPIKGIKSVAAAINEIGGAFHERLSTRSPSDPVTKQAEYDNISHI
ncbi:hypothetical protein TNCV_1954201 [Trichonephila clavipes]|nr:hypothetical protein TNCV_1954201 [Trichonephila clavipes]